MIGPYISEHKRTLDKDNIRDFVDLALVEIDDTTDPESGFFDEKGSKLLFRLFLKVAHFWQRHDDRKHNERFF